MKALHWFSAVAVTMVACLTPVGADDDRSRRTITSPPTGNLSGLSPQSYLYDRGRGHAYSDRPGHGPAPAYRPPNHVSPPARGPHWSQPVLPPGLHYSPTRGITPDFLGSVIVACDNTFLGVIDRKYWEPDSICNPDGRYGDPRSPYSIWNPDGRWGTKWGYDSPWNPNATCPPKVYFGNYFWGYLSTNRSLQPRINPYWLVEHLEKKLR